MKKIVSTFFFTIAGLFALVSCSVKDLSVVDQQETHKVHFVVNASSPETKTYIECVEVDNKNVYEVGWLSDDALAVFISDITGSTSSIEYVFENTKAKGTTASFEGDADVPAGEGEFCSFYPTTAFVKGYNDGTVGVNIGTTENSIYVQKPVAGSFDRNSDILIGKKCAYESDGDIIVIDDMYFTRPLSILKVNLLGSYAEGDVVESFKLTAPEGTVLGGRAKLNLSEYTIPDWTVKNNYVYAEVDNSEGDITINTGDNAIYLLVNPVTISKTAGDESTNSVTFEIETDKNTISKTVPLSKDLTFPAGNIAVINLTILEDNCTAKEEFTSKTYNKISDADQLADGEYIIALQLNGEDDVYYLENTVKTKPGGKAFATGIALSSDGETITISSKDITDATWTFASVTGGYSITSTSNTAAGLGTTSANDGLTCQTTYSGKAWTIDDDETYNWTFKYNETSRYMVVYSIANPRTYTSSSTNANGKFFIYQKEDGRTAIAAPTGLSVSGMTLSWTSVDGAASYNVEIGETVVNGVNTNSYTFTGDAGYYNVSVVAVPSDTDNYKNSAAATLADAKFGTPSLTAPTLVSGGVTVNSVTATWTDDPNASNGYHCEIYNGDSKVSEQDVAKGVQKVTFDSLTKGVEYTVKVNGKEVTGDKPYAASAVASINLIPTGVQVEDVTAAGSYSLTGLAVMAVNGRNIIAADNTGLILIYAASGHGKVVNDVIDVQGTVKAYNGVWEFDGPTITAAGTTTVTYPTPVEYDEANITAYATTPVIEYGHAVGLANSTARTVTVADGKVLNVYGDLSSVDGEYVSINGYAFGYYSSKVNFMLVGSPTVDTTYPTLSTTPEDGETISWNDDVFGSANAETITVNLNDAASGYSVSYTDSDSAWSVSDNGSGTITVYPIAANSSTTDDKTLDITIAHDDNPALTSTITLKQKKQSSGGTYSDYTSTFTSSQWGSSGDFGWTSGKAGAGFSNNGIQVTTNSTGANGTTNKSFTDVSQVVVTYNTNKSSGAGTLNLKIGSNTAQTKNWAYSGSADGREAKFTCVFDVSDESGAITLTANTTTNSIYIVSVTVTAKGISE